jgi:hypothetical protein
MIVVRNVFRLKFGKAREAQEVMKELNAINARVGHGQGTRLLTDATGPFYTLVLELSFGSLSDVEKSTRAITADPAWKAAYARMVPLVDSGFREIFNVVE